MIALVAVAKKDIKVRIDEGKKTPWAEVIPANGFAQIRIYLSPADLAVARCLQKMPT